MQYFSQTIAIDSNGNGGHTFTGLNGKIWGYQINRGTTRKGELSATAIKPACVFAVRGGDWNLDLRSYRPRIAVHGENGAVIANQFDQVLLIDDTVIVAVSQATPSTSFTFELWVE